MSRVLPSIVGILGFGVDGQAVAEWLSDHDGVERILVFSDEAVSDERLAASKKIERASSLEDVNLLFRSPGFPLTHPLVKEAKKKGIEITSSTIEVLKNFSGTTIGVTGSNGKTTCVALIEEFLKAEFGEEHVERGGNDGVPRLDLILGPSPIPSYLVLELSSFQLMDSPVSPNVAVALNITPNHLDWHASMEEYIEAKRQIVAHQGSAGCQPAIAVLNQNDPIVKTFADSAGEEVQWLEDLPRCDIKCLSHPDTLKAAVTAARALKVSGENIIKVLEEFPGVPHRLEFVRELDGQKWYNDSSCTTPESVITACEMFPKGSLTILMGGRDKGMDFSKLYEVINERDVWVIPYGEMYDTFRSNIAHSSQLTAHSSFEEAIEVAHTTGRPNIALSPACASFDMFKNAKERGKKFAEIVEGLK